MPTARFLYHPDSGDGSRAPTGTAPPPAPVLRQDAGSPKIKQLEQRLGAGVAKPTDGWARPPSSTGNGACHVKSFHCKLGGDSLEYLDRQINEWMDSHPECEVKLVTTTVGEWQGKLREPALIVQIWV